MVDGVPICVEKVQSSNMLRIQSRVGRVSSLIRGSTGKTLLAWQPEAFIAATLEQAFPDTEKGREERACLGKNLEKIRAQGYCISISEQDEGVASVCVPIRNNDGIAQYSLAIVGAEKRIREKGMAVIREEVVRTCRRLEEERRLLPC